MALLEEEHRAKMKILDEELSTKLLEREHRVIEHERALRNLDSMFEKYSSDTL